MIAAKGKSVSVLCFLISRTKYHHLHQKRLKVRLDAVDKSNFSFFPLFRSQKNHKLLLRATSILSQLLLVKTNVR
jgi:hypothetical protein